ncbi:MAG TPA: aminomethyl-transferring glycine dehydrogenase subunit GcvPA [Rhizomicrobium sp.]|jgi:glycine dehydrogenase subunit 1|nr:aminomethyl-transferring glycine dehydrogenase subunit GcvPA [Rhizomicrobium sp.]
MRYLPLTPDDRRAMLSTIGASSIDALFRDVPKEAVVGHEAFQLPDHQGELEVERLLSRLASKNIAAGTVPFFCGAGAYRHHVPASVDHLIQRSEFLTSYTPYQPEIAQGTLQYLFEFQTQVAMLTGMGVANASLYDGSTATAEAVLMAQRLTRRPKAVLSGGLHPHYAETVETLANLSGTVVRAPVQPGKVEDITSLVDNDTACVVVQSPDVFGLVRDLKPVAEVAHARGALLIAVVTEVVSLGLLESPGAMGADIAAAEGQSIGNGLNFGGPYVGLFATREKFIRQMPGRVAGETVDAEGKRGYVLTLSTREQHIRREKATSNICTNSGLCCLAFTIHLALLGERGFTRLARANHARASGLADKLGKVAGVEVITPSFFNEFTLRLGRPAAEVVDRLAARGILGGVPASRLLPHQPEMRDLLIVAATETASEEDCDAFGAALAECLS